jgi:putative transcription factor
MIEGAKMLACTECAKLGAVYWEVKTEPCLKKVAKRLSATMLPPRRQPPLSVAENIELVDDFGAKVRNAREKLGLSHEDLGKKISEKVSVLRKIESGKMAPNNLLAEKLKHILRIDLLVPVSEPEVPAKAMIPPASTMLGDVVQLKKDKGKEK